MHTASMGAPPRVTATCRFYGELGNFLPRERRGRAFDAPCAREATVKHMIEALGVPHTEVALILINGESSGLDRLLADGDRVAVYPHLSRFEVGQIQRVRAQPPLPLRFIADAHLGALARLLRMAGFDTLYDNSYRDDAIVAMAADTGRVVLTRDRELLKRRGLEFGSYLHAIEPDEQLRALFVRYNLGQAARPFTLCLHCNWPLRAVDKASILDRLPESVRALHHAFTLCEACGRVFWKGSHHRRMAAMLAGFTGDAGTPPAGGEA